MTLLQRIKSRYDNWVTKIISRRASRVLLRTETRKVYLGEKEFETLQNRYSPRPEYKYDEYHNWARGVDRAKQLMSLDNKFTIKPLSVFEMACGDGMVGRILHDYGHKVVQQDLEDWRDLRARKLAFIKSDLAELIPIPKNRFDLIFSYNSFEHIPNPKLTLNELTRICKPGGMIFLEFGPLYNSPWGLHAYKSLKMPYPQFLFSREFLKEKLREIGIRDLGKELDDLQPLNKWRFSQFETLWQKSELTLLRKELGRDYSHLNIINKYPENFSSYNLTIDEVSIQWIRVLFVK